VTLEDNAIAGGAGSAVAELLAQEGISLPLLMLGLPDCYLEHASREQLLSQVGLDTVGILDSIRRRFPALPMAANA